MKETRAVTSKQHTKQKNHHNNHDFLQYWVSPVLGWGYILTPEINCVTADRNNDTRVPIQNPCNFLMCQFSVHEVVSKTIRVTSKDTTAIEFTHDVVPDCVTKKSPMKYSKALRILMMHVPTEFISSLYVR